LAEHHPNKDLRKNYDKLVALLGGDDYKMV
jgi:hypothetical protein